MELAGAHSPERTSELSGECVTDIRPGVQLQAIGLHVHRAGLARPPRALSRQSRLEIEEIRRYQAGETDIGMARGHRRRARAREPEAYTKLSDGRRCFAPLPRESLSTVTLRSRMVTSKGPMTRPFPRFTLEAPSEGNDPRSSRRP